MSTSISDAIMSSFAARWDTDKQAAVKVLNSEVQKIEAEVVERRLQSIALIERKLQDFEERKAAGESINQDVWDTYAAMLKQAQGR